MLSFLHAAARAVVAKRAGGASMAEPTLTERQRKYFASMRASLERDTGKSLQEWAQIARTCPETKHRARLAWFKEHHGLAQNRASQVLNEAFPSETSWRHPDTLMAAIWTEPGSRTIYEAVDALASTLPGNLRTVRKSYVAWSRTFQFAAARPLKGGELMLGLALTTEADSRLEIPKNESWSERLKGRLRLAAPAQADQTIRALLTQAWERS
jgi:hypothetical protein